MSKNLLMGVLLTLVFTGCFINNKEKIKGNGKVITKEINTSNFNYLYVDNAIEVYYRQDSVFSIKVETDENLIDYLDIDADYRYNLVVSIKEGYRLSASDKIKVHITSPLIAIMEASGASGIYSQGIITTDAIMDIDVSGASRVKLELNAPSVKVNISGASTINLAGKTEQMEITASGASIANCFEITAAFANANVAGASRAELFVTNKLKADASGASSIIYKGSAEVNKNESGAGSIKRVE
jgi:Putative auto-transporter adhesin, head GIN domain